MAVVRAWKKLGRVPGLRIVAMKYTFGNGDTSIVVATGLKKIYSWAQSAPAITAKLVDNATVAGGTITIAVADPLQASYIFVTAYGI